MVYTEWDVFYATPVYLLLSQTLYSKKKIKKMKLKVILHSLLSNYLLFIIAADGLFRQNKLTTYLFIIIVLNLAFTFLFSISKNSFVSIVILVNFLLGVLMILLANFGNPKFVYSYHIDDIKSWYLFIIPAICFILISYHLLKPLLAKIYTNWHKS